MYGLCVVINWQFSFSKLFQRTLSRYFDATHVTAKLKPTFISKVNTAVQLATITASLAAPVYGVLGITCTFLRLSVYGKISLTFPSSAHPTLVGMWYLTGFTTAAAATSYILSKDTYQFIKNGKSLQK